MAYRNPRYYFHHAIRTAGIAALGGTTFATINGVLSRAYAHDTGASRLATFNGTAANQYLVADRGGGTLRNLDTVLIPSGHNFAGTNIQAYGKSSAPANGTDGTLRMTASGTAGFISVNMSPAISERYFTFVVPASGTAWAFPELFFTQQRTTTQGPDAQWRDVKEVNQVEQEMRSGEVYRLELGRERRAFEWTYRMLAGNDLLVFTELRTETRNGLYAFFVDPPDDGEPTLLMQLREPIIFEQVFPNPVSVGAAYDVTLKLIEVLA